MPTLFVLSNVIIIIIIMVGFTASWLNPLAVQNRYQLLCNESTCIPDQGRCLLDRCICYSGWDGLSCDVQWSQPVPECVELTINRDESNVIVSVDHDADDSCFYHPEYGVLQVTRNRWTLAQQLELKLWMRQVDLEDDRSDIHSNAFKGYQILPPSLGHVLEIACGPFTQLKHIMSQSASTVDSITLVDPMIFEYKQYIPHCSYKNNSFMNHIPILINARAEDLRLGERYDTVIMINGIEHAQDGLLILKNVYESLQPGYNDSIPHIVRSVIDRWLVILLMLTICCSAL